MNTFWRNLALALGCGAAAAAWVLVDGKWSGEQATVPIGGETSEVARLERIERELVALRKAIETLATRRDATRLKTPAQRLALDPAQGDGSFALGGGAAGQDWRQSLDALETRITDQLTALREGLREDLDRGLVPVRIRDAGGTIDWGAWEEVVALWHEDPDSARTEVKLMTADEVLERFGPPSDVLVNPNGLTWQYAPPADAATGRLPLEIILRIPDGYVVQLAVRDQRH